MKIVNNKIPVGVSYCFGEAFWFSMLQNDSVNRYIGDFPKTYVIEHVEEPVNKSISMVVRQLQDRVAEIGYRGNVR